MTADEMKYFTAVLLMVCAAQALAHSNGDIRLVDGVSSSMGRVQMYYFGHWTGICGNRANSAADQVICRSAGFSASRPTRFRARIVGPVSERTLLDRIRCRGNESNILQCKHSAFGDAYCGINARIAVDCYAGDIGSRVELRNGTSTDGILVIGNNNDQIGTVCARYWSYANSYVACRMLGVDTSRFTPIILNRTYYGETTDYTDLSYLSSELECNGDETNLTHCQRRGISDTKGWYCQHLGDVAIDCHGSANIEVSLVNGNATAGEVRLVYRGENVTACAAGNPKPAKVLCRMLGYREYEGVLLDPIDVASGTMMMFRFWCTGDERNIAECGLYVYTGEWCNQATAIACRPQPVIAVRLVNGNATSGFLEVQRNGQWGRICNPDNTMDYRGNAAVVCRMLHLPTQNVVTMFSRRAVKPVILDSLNCAGDEDNLNQCYHDQTEYCNGHDVWISCA